MTNRWLVTRSDAEKLVVKKADDLFQGLTVDEPERQLPLGTVVNVVLVTEGFEFCSARGAVIMHRWGLFVGGCTGFMAGMLAGWYKG